MSWIDDFAYLLQPLNADLISEEKPSEHLVGFIDLHTSDHFPDLNDVNIVLIGIKETRRCPNGSSSLSPDVIREKLFPLFHHRPNIKIADLGNIDQGASPYDTDHAVKIVVKHMVDRNIAVVILGGSQELTFANY